MKFNTAELSVETIPCDEPNGSFVSSFVIVVNEETIFSSGFWIGHYVEKYPNTKVLLCHATCLNLVARKFDFEGFYSALNSLILSYVLDEIDCIVTTPAEFQALQDFLTDFERPDIDIAYLADFIISPRLAERLQQIP